jgi:hypothetical protein
MKTVIGFLVWLVLRAYVLVTRKPSFTFVSPAGVPYLQRWPIATRDPWPDAIGRTGGEGWYLHQFLASDHERQLHNHPSAYAVAFVLRGGYSEKRFQRDELNPRPVMHERKPGTMAVITGETFHRVILPPACTYGQGDAGLQRSWSLFYIGPRSGKGWGFLDDAGRVRRADHHDGRTGAVVSRYSAGSRRVCDNPQRACTAEPTAGATLCPECNQELGKPVRS